ncbi:phosphofurin acidic cluster sorting protein 1 isoform X1 [Lampetra fluviatilis]
MATPPVKPPVTMNLFATWEVDKASPSCVPRLFSMTLKKLMVLKDLDKELNSVVIAVKLQGSKRILRSNEIPLPPSGLIEADLELTFSLQYPHFLKRESNKLQIMLQRRKRYKNRTFLGYKTLAAGFINMTEVMQHPTDGGMVLGLHGNIKESTAGRSAEICIFSLSSQPVDQEETVGPGERKNKALDRSADADNYSEDDDESFSSEQDASDEHVQDMYDDYNLSGKSKKSRHRKVSRAISLSRQPNLKQKVVALLKRFRVMDENLDLEQDPGDQTREMEEEEDLNLLYDSLELDNPSDSGPDMDDNESVVSAPKPTLKPFFQEVSNSSSQTEIASIKSMKSQPREVACQVESPDKLLVLERKRFTSDTSTDECPQELRETDTSPGSESGRVEALLERLPPRGKMSRTESQIITSPSRVEVRASLRKGRSSSLRERSSSRLQSVRASSLDNDQSPDPQLMQTPQRSVYEQLNRILGTEDQLPESVMLINTADWQGQYVSSLLQKDNQPVVCTASLADVQAVFVSLVSRIQRFCNSNPQTPEPIRVAVVGDLSHLHAVLRCFVDQLSQKTSDWLGFLRFLIIPLGCHGLAKYLASLDSKYGGVFLDPVWQEMFTHPEPPTTDLLDVTTRIVGYVSGANVTHPLPIAEAMLTYKQKGLEEESCQKFIPFISIVNVGVVEQMTAPIADMDESLLYPSVSLTSTPSTSAMGGGGSKDICPTPPASPSVGPSPVSWQGGEVMGLHVDYWTVAGAERRREGERDRKEGSGKTTLKSNFRSLQVSRLPTGPGEGPSATPSMCMTVVTKEKNKKGIFLTKKPKEKDIESKSQVIDGISRLICAAKQQQTMLKVTVDGVEWNDVKFFQLAAQWPTHVKHFPVGLFAQGRPGC